MRMEYSPELIPRRGELYAWLSALLVLGVWILLGWLEFPVTFFLPLLGIPLVLVAASISLGNWMDRHTILALNPDGVSYRNGLRNVTFSWDEIRKVRVLPAQWGDKVEVFGNQAYFRFHTLGEVKARGKIMGRTGFAEGKWVAEQIVENAGLQLSRPVESESGYFYSRR